MVVILNCASNILGGCGSLAFDSSTLPAIADSQLKTALAALVVLVVKWVQ